MIQIRRVFTHLEEIRHEFGPVADVPLLRGAIGAVLTNPFAGRYEPDILPMMDALQDVGLDMAQRLLKAMGVPYVIIGHSERRQYFGETNETVNKRVRAALDNGLKVILCVGEVLEERAEEEGAYFRVRGERDVVRALREQFDPAQ